MKFLKESQKPIPTSCGFESKVSRAAANAATFPKSPGPEGLTIFDQFASHWGRFVIDPYRHLHYDRRTSMIWKSTQADVSTCPVGHD